MSYKYMIHTCEDRKWYVNKFLIPSMLEQGIQKHEIIVSVDREKQGILLATLLSFDFLGRTQNWDDIVWHLQDDVVLSKTFKQRTDELYGDIICGFCSRYDKSKKFGAVDKGDMWYSFPCIGIKNFIAKECANWFFEGAMNRDDIKFMINRKKYIDTLFREFFIDEYNKPLKIYNVNPNLVDHIDYLIGGSIANAKRDEKQVRAYYWREIDVIRDIEQALQKSVSCN